jgi:hypothetical protein
MRATLIAVAVAVTCALLAGGSAAQILHAVPLEGGRALGPALDLGARVRYVGNREALVEGDAAFRSVMAARGMSARRLTAARTGEGLYIAFPDRTWNDASPPGVVMWSEPDGARLVACGPEGLAELRAASYMVYQLPESINVASWFDNTPPAHLRARTPDHERLVRGVVEDAINAVSEDSLMSHVTNLSEYPGGELRSRYTFRDECLGEAKPYIVSRLTDYLPGAVEPDLQGFHERGFSCDESGEQVDYPAENIIGVLEGTGDLSGYYVVCAHYDAIATNSFPGDNLWWCDNPAPGADDNATGVATVLEAARVLSQLSFPFDIRFALFSGEELGLLGSEVYADSVAGYRQGSGYVAQRDTIYGVFNVDMIAYKTDPSHNDTCHIVTNPGSAWMADWLVGTAETEYSPSFPDFDVSRIDTALSYSDHAHFWQNDYDAVVAIEHWQPQNRNPYYHRTEDTVENVYASQLSGVARMLVGAIARMAHVEGMFNLALFDDDVAFYTRLPSGFRYRTDHVTLGDPLTVRVDFHAFGAEQDVDATLEVWDGPIDEGELLSSRPFSRVMGGGEVLTHEFDWTLGDSDVGDHEISVILRAPETDEPQSDNTVENVLLRVDAPDLYLAEHFVWPNPASSPSEINIAYRPSREIEGGYVEVRVFDLLGQEVGEITLGSQDQGTWLEPTLNPILWSEMEGAPDSPSSGVYVYQVSVYEGDSTDPTDRRTGKFALVR